MKVSVCITVFNEEKSIKKLLESLLDQTLEADEIVIVDGGSEDGTVDIINSFSKKNQEIELIVKKCTRAEGRNLSVKKATNDIIAMTDADCFAYEDWLENITRPFKDKKVDISAGFYAMKAETALDQAIAFFLGITPERFDQEHFLPSTRSIAFRKRIWEEIGGFPESDNNSAEDTDFNYQAQKKGAVYSRVKNAKVEWRTPDTLFGFAKKIYSYAKWDAEYGIWWNPAQKFASHNIKALLVIIRYLLGILIIVGCFLGFLTPIFPLGLTILYFTWAFNKVYRSTNNINSGFWGICLQLISDISVGAGFITGTFYGAF